MKQEEILHKEFFYKGLEIRGIDWYNNEKSAGAACCPHCRMFASMEDSVMKQKSKQNRLSIGVIVLGCCALVLRRLLYGVAVDVKNLLPVNHPLEIALWVLSAGANLWIVASVWKLDGSPKYEDNFQPSLTAAVGHYIAAAGILLTVLLPWGTVGRLVLLRRVLGVVAAVGLIVAGRCRKAGKCPLFLTHLAVCAFFVVHMLGNYGIWCSNPQLQDYWLDLSASALMALFAFYEAAFDAGMGRRRMQLATGLMAAYLGYAALSGSGYLILYFGCAVWALTDLCSLTPKPKQENAA